MSRRNNNKIVRFISRYVGLGVICIWILPIVYILLGSVVSTGNFTANNFTSGFTLENYQTTIMRKNWADALLNSVIVSSCSVAFIIICGSMCAYALSRWGRNKIGFQAWLLSTRMLPGSAVFLAFIIWFRILGLMDTVAGLIIINVSINIALFVWLLMGYFNNTDPSAEEVLRSEGARPWVAYWKVAMKKTRIPIFRTAILCFILCWNEYFFASAIALGGNSKTLPPLVADFLTSQDIMWGPMFASCIMMIAPAIFAVAYIEMVIMRAWSAVLQKER